MRGAHKRQTKHMLLLNTTPTQPVLALALLTLSVRVDDVLQKHLARGDETRADRWCVQGGTVRVNNLRVSAGKGVQATHVLRGGAGVTRESSRSSWQSAGRDRIVRRHHGRRTQRWHRVRNVTHAALWGRTGIGGRARCWERLAQYKIRLRERVSTRLTFVCWVRSCSCA